MVLEVELRAVPFISIKKFKNQSNTGAVGGGDQSR